MGDGLNRMRRGQGRSPAGPAALTADREMGGDLGDDCGGHGHGLRARASWTSWRRRSARRLLQETRRRRVGILVAVGDREREKREGDDMWGHGVSERASERGLGGFGAKWAQPRDFPPLLIILC